MTPTAQLDNLIMEVLTRATFPMTSGHVFHADARFTDKKAIINALTRLKDSGRITHDGTGYVVGKSVGNDYTEPPGDPVDRALALLGRQSFNGSSIHNFNAKVQALQRLEQLLEPHIGRLLHQIREDLERFNAMSSKED